MRSYLILAICGAADLVSQSSAAVSHAVEVEDVTGAVSAAAESRPIALPSSSEADIIGEEPNGVSTIAAALSSAPVDRRPVSLEEVAEEAEKEAVAGQSSSSTEDPASEILSAEVVPAAPPHELVKQVYSNEGDDYAGADAGVLVALPQRVVGALPPYEGFDLTLTTNDESVEADAEEVGHSGSWPIASSLFPFYEWSIAQARGNRYALPEPSVQLLEQLEKSLSLFDQGLTRELTVERRRLQIDGLLSALGSGVNGAGLLNPADASNLAFDAHQLPTLVNAISGSVSNVVQAAGEAVGVSTTTAAPVNQAVMAMLSILQGFQQLAVAAGSMGANMRPVA